MNILVIGNGFDLAHGLPTKYGDFLEFCERVRIIYTSHMNVSLDNYKANNIDNWKVDDSIKNVLLEAFGKRYIKENFNDEGTNNWNVTTSNELLNEFYSCIKENTWLRYFRKCRLKMSEGWIDFEKEISKVILRLDNKNMEARKVKFELGNKGEQLALEYLIRDTIDCLCDDLDKVIRALEIYLADYIERIKVKTESYDIRSIFDEIEKSLSYKQCNIISFNYTNTFEQLYGNRDTIDFKYDFVHGKANITNTLETNNMVLGIDEYLRDDRRNSDIDLIAFKKYFQRIYKGVGCKYKNWIDTIRNSDNFREMKRIYEKEFPFQVPFRYFADQHYVYIFGHSLDITDKDIIKELILNDNVYTTIFYKDKKQQGQQIENLVKVIKKDELIRRTSGITKTIEFKLQRNMKKL